MSPRLHTDVIGGTDDPAEHTVRMLHGIYGRGRNLRRFARMFVEAHPAWKAELVDLRAHGASGGFTPPHTVEAAAGDVVELGPAPDLLLGHSFGGKVALLTLRDPDFRPDQVWVVDASPGARPPQGLPWEMIGILRRRTGPFEDRDAGISALESEGVPRGVARWMATNLSRDDQGRMRWEISADTMESLLLSYFSEDAWDVVEDGPDATSIHFVKASDSGALSSEDAERIEAAGRGGDVHLHEVSGGHWLHTENPDGLLEVMGGAVG